LVFGGGSLASGASAPQIPSDTLKSNPHISIRRSIFVPPRNKAHPVAFP
jgi:hypothetical protein